MIKISYKPKITYIFLLIILGIPLFTKNSQLYIVFLTAALFLVCYNHKAYFLRSDTVFKIPMVFVLTWLYGVFLGLANGNVVSDVISNFAGMMLYSICYLIPMNKIDKEKLYRVIYLSSIIATFAMVISFIIYNFGNKPMWPLSNIHYNRWRGNIDADIKNLPFVLEAITVWRFLHRGNVQKKILDALLLVITAVSVIITTDSGGSLLGFISVFGIVLLMSIFSNKRSAKYWFLSSMTFILIVVLAIFIEYKFGIVQEHFSPTRYGNDKRLNQLHMVIERFKLLGNGLGARFSYEFDNKKIVSYGIEAVYLNLIDKFGVLSIGIFLGYIYSFIKPIKKLIKNPIDAKYYVCCIGLLGYLFVAVGNPIIFSPYNVMLHILCLLFLDDTIKETEAEQIHCNIYKSRMEIS